MLRITVEGDNKEIAAFIDEIQKQQTEDVKNLKKDFAQIQNYILKERAESNYFK